MFILNINLDTQGYCTCSEPSNSLHTFPTDDINEVFPQCKEKLQRVCDTLRGDETSVLFFQRAIRVIICDMLNAKDKIVENYIKSMGGFSYDYGLGDQSIHVSLCEKKATDPVEVQEGERIYGFTITCGACESGNIIRLGDQLVCLECGNHE